MYCRPRFIFSKSRRTKGSRESIDVHFYNVEAVENSLLAFAVIAAYAGACENEDGAEMPRWVFCRHKARKTWEIPGGKREKGEEIAQTAARELYEETGFSESRLFPVCAYSVTLPGQSTEGRADTNRAESFGLLYVALIGENGVLAEPLPPESEMQEVVLASTIPGPWTYPEIQPKLLEQARAFAARQGIFPAGDR